MVKNNKGLVLFSGGMDSFVAMLWAKDNFDEVVLLFIDYGQQHIVEKVQAIKIAKTFNMEIEVITTSLLTDILHKEAVVTSEIPYVPNRNAILISAAHTLSIARGITNIVGGMCLGDSEGFPDCREGYLYNLIEVLNLPYQDKINLHTPLLNSSKEETYLLAGEAGYLAELLELTHTCYNGVRDKLHPWGYGCGECPSCVTRVEGWVNYKEQTL